MGDEAHDIRDFFGRHQVSVATLLDEIRVDIMFLSSQDGGLMEAYTCSMYIHM